MTDTIADAIRLAVEFEEKARESLLHKWTVGNNEFGGLVTIWEADPTESSKLLYLSFRFNGERHDIKEKISWEGKVTFDATDALDALVKRIGDEVYRRVRDQVIRSLLNSISPSELKIKCQPPG